MGREWIEEEGNMIREGMGMRLRMARRMGGSMHIYMRGEGREGKGRASV